MTTAEVIGYTLAGYVSGFTFNELWWQRFRIRQAWYRWRHPRCEISRECLLDNGHKGDCDEEPYT